MADSSFNSQALNDSVAQLSSPVNLSPSLNATSVPDLVGNFTYIMTAFNGGETLPSTGVFIVGTGSSISVDADSVSGATNYRLYRSGDGYDGYVLCSQSGSLPIIDLAEISGGSPPSVNSTAFKSRSMSDFLTTFYTVSEIPKTLVKEILISNSFNELIDFDIHFVPSGEFVGVGNAAFTKVSLDASETKILSLNTVILEGDTIQAKSSSIGQTPGYGAASIKISGIEITEE